MFFFVVVFILLAGAIAVAFYARTLGRSASAWGVLTFIATLVSNQVMRALAEQVPESGAAAAGALSVVVLLAAPAVFALVLNRLPAAAPAGLLRGPIDAFRMGDRDSNGAECTLAFDDGTISLREGQETLSIPLRCVAHATHRGECVCIAWNTGTDPHEVSLLVAPSSQNRDVRVAAARRLAAHLQALRQAAADQ